MPGCDSFLCKAKETDARISEDLEQINMLRNHVLQRHNYPVPVVGIVTQVDELAPLRVGPPFDDERKKHNIAEAKKNMRQALVEEAGVEPADVVATAAYTEHDGDAIVDRIHWNIDGLVDKLVTSIPRSAQVQLARTSAVQSAQASLARKIVYSTSTVCSGIAATPIPSADIAPITISQIGMILGVGYIAGHPMSYRSALIFLRR